MTSKETRRLKDLAYEVRDERGQLIALFMRRWQAEKFAEGHNFVVVEREA